MKPEIKEKWLAALRSGEYKQGQCALRKKDNKFCCLGVLADLYAKEMGIEWKMEEDCYKILDQGGTLPIWIADWAEIMSDGYVDRDHLTLASMNDHGHTFSEIADVIEKHF